MTIQIRLDAKTLNSPSPSANQIGIWFALQLLSGIGTLGAADQGGVAYMAHIGGFVAGVVLTWLFARGPRMQV